MRNRKRKPEQPEEEGSPAWMNTYGDMITLLLAFFVLLFSFSTIDALKWKEIVSSLSGTPFVAIQALDPGGAISEDEETENILLETPEPTQMTVSEVGNIDVKEKFDELFEKIKNHIDMNGLENILNVQESDDTILIRMTDSALFNSGDDEIRKDAKLILLDVCGILQEYVDLIKMIRIEGHTDNNPISTAKFESNWDLSTSRAVKVLRYLLGIMEIEPANMSAVGFGEYHPVESNDTLEGKAKNRRVDFVIESINKD